MLNTTIPPIDRHKDRWNPTAKAAPHPYRHLSRRSGRNPAEPYRKTKIGKLIDTQDGRRTLSLHHVYNSRGSRAKCIFLWAQAGRNWPSSAQKITPQLV